MSLATETKDHPARRDVAPETDFCMVPIAMAPERIQAITPRLIELLAVAGNGAFVAGGCLRDVMLGRPPKDIDVYFSQWIAWTESTARVVAAGAQILKEDLNRTIVSHPAFGRVDLLYSCGDGPLGQIRKFDFIACCAALHPEGFAFHRTWAEQVHAGVLRFNACPNPRKTVERLERFRERGWSIRPDDQAMLLDVAVNAPERGGEEYF